MMSGHRAGVVRAFYDAFAAEDRGAFEERMADDFSFSSPADPGLDRAGFLERCWPGSAGIAAVDIVRLIEAGDEVVVTYEAARTGGGGRFRNTEVLTFHGDRIGRAEVYFGWDLP